jgi:hypothetical protein
MNSSTEKGRRNRYLLFVAAFLAGAILGQFIVHRGFKNSLNFGWIEADGRIHEIESFYGYTLYDTSGTAEEMQALNRSWHRGLYLSAALIGGLASLGLAVLIRRAVLARLRKA